jgi:hypothetical protein
MSYFAGGLSPLLLGTHVILARKAVVDDTCPEMIVSITTEFANDYVGMVVTLTGNVLLMTTRDGSELAWLLDPDARLTRDGCVCLTGDLKYGMRIRVTIASDGRRVVTRIEALVINDDFEKRN